MATSLSLPINISCLQRIRVEKSNVELLEVATIERRGRRGTYLGSHHSPHIDSQAPWPPASSRNTGKWFICSHLTTGILWVIIAIMCFLTCMHCFLYEGILLILSGQNSNTASSWFFLYQIYFPVKNNSLRSTWGERQLHSLEGKGRDASGELAGCYPHGPWSWHLL